MLIKHFFTKQFIFFLLVGITSAGINWFSRWAINHWLDFSIAVILAYGFGMASAYILNRLFVFQHVSRPMLAQIRDFMIINLAMFPVVFLGAILFNKLLLIINITFYNEDIAHAFALSLPVVFTFLIYKLHVFRSY